MPGPKAIDPVKYRDPRVESMVNTTVFKSRKGQLLDDKYPMTEHELDQLIANTERKLKNNNSVAREDPALAKIAKFANRGMQPQLDQLYKAKADYRRQRDAGVGPDAPKAKVRKSSGGSVRRKLPNW